jgi:hypothetical protein
MPNKSSAMKLMLLGLAILTMASACLGQSYWKRTYGGTGNDVAYAITPTPDGNFIVAGQTNSFGAGGYDVYLIKIKPNGDTLWTKTYGGTDYDVSYALTPASDGDFIVAGGTTSFGAGYYDVYLLKIKPDGDTVWTKTYGGKGYDEAYDIMPTPDGNFIVAGRTNSFDAELSDAYLLKIKPDGDTIWTKTHGATVNGQASAVTAVPGGNFIVAGFALSVPDRHAYTCLFKMKPDGDTLWTKTNVGSSYDRNTAVTPTSDGNFIVAGTRSTCSILCEGMDAYFSKINPDGDTLWTKSYGGTTNDWANSILPTPDGNFIVVGTTSSFGAGGQDAYILKIKPDGDTLWTKTYGGTGNDEALAITPASDGFIIAGHKNLSVQNDDIWLIFMIDDRYAKKDSLFTFKIPVWGDSLNFGYLSLKAPSGMTVSMGGTISWTPKTDSVYMDHVEFLVSDDFGKKDTLTFNIFVNSKDHPVKAIDRLSLSGSLHSKTDISVQSLSSKEVRFSLPNNASALQVYDVRGQLLENLSVKGGRATWRPGRAAGRYFAKAIVEKKEMVRPFVVVR